jgi:hypothetical protein
MTNLRTMKKRWTRDTMRGRFTLINQACIPDHYTRATGKNKGRHNIRPALCKALLRYLSLWDNPGGQQFMSNERVAHEMEMPLGTLAHVSEALVETGMLSRESRGPGLTERWVLHWDAIESSNLAATSKQASKEVPR